MIPALIIWLFKKYIGPSLKKKRLLTKTPAAMLLFIAFSLAAAAKERVANYAIRHNGKVIGSMQLQQTETEGNLYLKLASQVKTRMLIGIQVSTSDQAHFANGRLQYSTVTRVVNGKEKESKNTRWTNDAYHIRAGKKTGLLKGTISYNMMLLYTKEPVNINQVYSDNFQQFLAIRKTGAHSYRIELPDGNYNDYHFANGICTLVVVHHSLYTIKMELV